MLKSIKINVGGKDIDLTIEEARVLFSELQGLFPVQQNVSYVPTVNPHDVGYMPWLKYSPTIYGVATCKQYAIGDS